MTPEERATKALEGLGFIHSCVVEAIRAAVAEEREACARVADDPYGPPPYGADVTDDDDPNKVGDAIAAAIRVREFKGEAAAACELSVPQNGATRHGA